MIAKTHLAGGLAVTAGLHSVGLMPADLLGMILVPIAALMADLDHPKSSMGRKMIWLSGPISLLVRHRSATHSALAVVGMWAAFRLLATFLALPSWWVVALTVSFASHAVLDMASGGVELLWPLSTKRVALGYIQTEGIGDKLTGLALGLAAAAYWLRIFGWI